MRRELLCREGDIPCVLLVMQLRNARRTKGLVGMSPEGVSRPGRGADAAADAEETEPLPAGSGAVSALPGGTVTFAFTDIEGSTRLLQRLGDGRYAELLGRHRRLVRGAFYAADGIEVDRQGDACFFAVPRARDAVRAAVEIQRKHAAGEWPDNASVRVRVGLHTGEPSIGSEGYLGVDVVKGARICGVAHGGQVILSASTHALTAAALPGNVTAAPLGERQLKDIDEPEALYVLVLGESAATEPGSVPESAVPSEWERQIETRFGTVGAGVARSMSGRIARSVAAITASHARPPAWQEVTGKDLEQLAGRVLKLRYAVSRSPTA